MDNDSLFFRKLIVTAGCVLASGSLGVLIFEWLGDSPNKDYIGILAGLAGGLVWQLEKYLLRKTSDEKISDQAEK